MIVKRWRGPYLPPSTVEANRLIAYHASNLISYDQNTVNRTNILWWTRCDKYPFSLNEISSRG